MKQNLLLLLLMTVFFACDTDKESSRNQPEQPPEPNVEEVSGTRNLTQGEFPQEWKLVQMSTMMVNSTTTGDDMPYQETYTFNRDYTFTKSRNENGNTIEADGTFNLITGEDGEEYYKLRYNEKNDLIENCSVKDEEYLILKSEKSLHGTANACDYPSKLYSLEE